MGLEFWIVAEYDGDGITDLTKEMLGIAKAAAQNQDIKVCAVLLTGGAKDMPKLLAAYGAEKIYLAEHEVFRPDQADACVDTMAELVKEHRPVFIFCGMTVHGRELAARLSARLKTLLVPACTALKPAGDGNFEVTSLVYNGLAQSAIEVGQDGPFILALAPKSRGIEPPEESGDAQLVAVNPVLAGAPAARHIETFICDYHALDLSEAGVVVSGGHGMGDEVSFQWVWKLGDLLGATVGGSRVAVDKGWLPAERMVGTTGKAVHCDLYLALGISGAIQHLMSIRDARAVVAVNHDPRAPIMQIADLAVVGNAREVVPALIKKAESYRTGLEAGLVSNDTENEI